WPVSLRRIADMQDVEAPAEQGHAQRQQGGHHEAPDELGDETELAGCVDRQGIAVDRHPLELFVAGIETLGLRADHAHPVAGLRQRRGLQPDAAVEWNRQILDDDQNTTIGHALGFLAKRSFTVEWALQDRTIPLSVATDDSPWAAPCDCPLAPFHIASRARMRAGRPEIDTGPGMICRGKVWPPVLAN